jgi:DNA-binding beta-propeller fold protein YncE
MTNDTEVIVGYGEYRYRVVEDWAKLPDGWSLSDVPSIAIDENDNVYLFNRGEHSLIIFDRNGNFLRSWGIKVGETEFAEKEGQFKRAHGILLSPDNTVFLTDEGNHTFSKYTRDGKLLFTVGTPGKPAPLQSNKPFNRCNQVALSPKGDVIYVADGYGNGAVHMYDPNGKYIRSWGQTGSGPGEFNIVHDICCDGDGWVYVADRENHRIQVFDNNGKYIKELHNLHRPCGLFLKGRINPILFIGELCPQTRTNHDFPNLGPRISIMDCEGRLLCRLGTQKFGLGNETFLGPHGVAVDSHGDLYVGEVSEAQWYYFWPHEIYSDKPMPHNLHYVRKYVKIA